MESSTPTISGRSTHPRRVLFMMFILVYVLVLVVSVFSVYIWQHDKLELADNNLSKLQSQVTASTNAAGQQIQPQNFQAVFLTNGQAYFGKLSILNDQNYQLNDVYFLNTNNNNQLEKLSNAQPHLPEDSMVIPTSSVSLWENLQNANQFNGQLK